MRLVRFLTVLFSISILEVFAQPDLVDESIRFSLPQLNGSARILGFGGAQTSLGGDISSAFSNPAGLGMFNRSTASLTPSLNFHNTTAKNALGEPYDDFRLNMSVGQMGFVFYNGKRDFVNDKFRGGSFGFSLTRVQDFHSVFNYRDVSGSSKINYFVDRANLDGLNDPYAEGAFVQYLIDGFHHYDINDQDGVIAPNLDSDSLYGTYVVGTPDQKVTYSDKGGHYSLNISWGGNYDDRLFFGAGLGIQTLRYRTKETLLETNFLMETSEGSGQFILDPVINSLEIREDRVVNGNGFNLNIGLIYRPTNFLQLGLSYFSPAYLFINEEFEFDLRTDMNSYDYWAENEDDDRNLEDVDNDIYDSPIFTSNYTLRTPARLNLGGSLIVGKVGFLTADVEMIDYKSAVIRTDEGWLRDENTRIDNELSNGINIRGGGELRIDKIRLRVGANLIDNPYKSEISYDFDRYYTFGGGFRNSDYYFDIAYIHHTPPTLSYSNYEFTNLSNDVPFANIERDLSRVTFTFGLNF